MQRAFSWRQGFRLCLVWSVVFGAVGIFLGGWGGTPLDSSSRSVGGEPPGPANPQEKPPERFTLPVQLHSQETPMWCWAATGQMIMEYMGVNVSQSEQANRRTGRTDCGRRPVPRACVMGGGVVLGPYGFRYDIAKQPLSEEEIVRQIYTLRKPIPFAWRWPGGGGHAALVVGYVRGADGSFLVECLDPFPPPGKDPRSWAGGQRMFMSHSRWAGDYDHAFDHALFNVTNNP